MNAIGKTDRANVGKRKKIIMLEGSIVQSVILVVIGTVIGTILSWALRSVTRRCWKNLSSIWLSRSYDFNYWYGQRRYFWRLDRAYYARYPPNKDAPATVEVVFWGLLYYARVRSCKTPKRKWFLDYKKAAEWVENYIYPKARPNPYSKPKHTVQHAYIRGLFPTYSEEDKKKGRDNLSAIFKSSIGHSSYPKVVFLGRNSCKLAIDEEDVIIEELDRGGGPYIGN